VIKNAREEAMALKLFIPCFLDQGAPEIITSAGGSCMSL